MKFSTGVDIVEVSTIESQLSSKRFLNRVFTHEETLYCQRFENYSERFAARFAAKEAVMKALGTGWSTGVQWSHIEIVNDLSGAPRLVLYKTALNIFNDIGFKNSTISLSHCRNYAIASVVLYA